MSKEIIDEIKNKLDGMVVPSGSDIKVTIEIVAGSTEKKGKEKKRKNRVEYRVFPSQYNSRDRELPYEFDLHFDIKSECELQKAMVCRIEHNPTAYIFELAADYGYTLENFNMLYGEYKDEFECQNPTGGTDDLIDDWRFYYDGMADIRDELVSDVSPGCLFHETLNYFYEICPGDVFVRDKHSNKTTHFELKEKSQTSILFEIKKEDGSGQLVGNTGPSEYSWPESFIRLVCENLGEDNGYSDKDSK